MTRTQLTKQFIKYMVGGGVYFCTGYLIFAFCYGVLGWDWFPSKVLADVIGWTLGFFVQRYWAFHHPALAGRAVKITGRYIFINVVNFLIDYLIVWGLNSVGVSPYIGLIVAACFFTGWNYFWFKFWVFSPRR